MKKMNSVDYTMITISENTKESAGVLNRINVSWSTIGNDI